MTAAHGTSRSIEILDELSSDDQRAVEGLIEEAALTDGEHAISEQGRLRLRKAREGVRHLLLTEGGRLAGYARLESTDPVEAPAAELVVRPESRCRGHGRALGRALLVESGKRLRVWAHGGHPAARYLAGALGLELFRELRRMRRPLLGPKAPPLPEVALPEGLVVRTFRPGADEEAWLSANAVAFAHHPEQGSWSREDLTDRMAQPWFDPKGFFLAVRREPGRSERIVGFHWTKEHPREPGEDQRLGEVYVVGVDPAERGYGLGGALTVMGLRHLARCCSTAMLYVDADNEAAVTLYERLGFTVHTVDLMYRSES